MIADCYKFEELRDRRRKTLGRIAYDCFHLKLTEDDRAYCSKGVHLGRSEDGAIDLSLILKGITPEVCKQCKDFEGEDETSSS